MQISLCQLNLILIQASDLANIEIYYGNLLLPDIFLLSQKALSDGSLNGGLKFFPSGFVLNLGKDRGDE